jgi:hypothetical protein
MSDNRRSLQLKASAEYNAEFNRHMQVTGDLKKRQKQRLDEYNSKSKRDDPEAGAKLQAFLDAIHELMRKEGELHQRNKKQIADKYRGLWTPPPDEKEDEEDQPTEPQPKLTLPPENTEAGIIARLLLAETPTPWSTHWEGEQNDKVAMQWMVRVLINRKNYSNPGAFYAPKNPSLTDVIKAHDAKSDGKAKHTGVQFAGFDTYPHLPSSISNLLQSILAIANNPKHSKYAPFRAHVQNALDVAHNPVPIPDPSGTGLYFWFTAGQGSPGGDAVPFRRMGGNQFYTMKQAKKK